MYIYILCIYIYNSLGSSSLFIFFGIQTSTVWTVFDRISSWKKEEVSTNPRVDDLLGGLFVGNFLPSGGIKDCLEFSPRNLREMILNLTIAHFFQAKNGMVPPKTPAQK